jgi:predicted Zn-dependent peptidase
MLKLAETLTEKEVVRAKEYLLGKLPLSLEGSMEVAQFAGMRALMTDEVRQPQEVVEAIEKVSLKDVKKVLEQVMVESEIRTCVVGPK